MLVDDNSKDSGESTVSVVNFAIGTPAAVWSIQYYKLCTVFVHEWSKQGAAWSPVTDGYQQDNIIKVLLESPF